MFKRVGIRPDEIIHPLLSTMATYLNPNHSPKLFNTIAGGLSVTKFVEGREVPSGRFQ